MNSRLAFAALTFAGLCWGLGFPMGKLSMGELNAAHIVLLRFVVAGIVSAPFALASKEARALFRSPAVLAAGVLYGVGFLMQFEGLAHVTITLAALLVGAMPALIAVCAWAMGEKVSPASWIGVAAATAGAALIAGRPGSAGSTLGVALSIGSLFIFLAWFVVVQKAPRVRSGMAVPAVTVVIAAVTILPLTLLMHGAPSLRLSAVSWLGILGQGVFSTLLATAAWQYGAARVSSASAGVFVNIEPVCGALIGVLVFRDPLTLAIAAGGTLIVLGSLVVVLGEKAPALSALRPSEPSDA